MSKGGGIIMMGKIHSIESFGALDGPGLRFVVFLQGCPLRCAYCHNPDTWSTLGGKETDPADLIKEYKKKMNFYKGGGITVTGGEPLLQVPFLIDLFTQAKKIGVHTCIDSSGIVFRPDNKVWMAQLEELLKLTDLVMLDIKHIDPVKHKKLTKHTNKSILAFAQYLSDKSIDIWVRHVVVPGITDDENDLYKLGYFIGGLTNVRALDVLPYHTMGINKYEQMGIEYPLLGVPPMDKNLLLDKKQCILNGIRDRRNGVIN